MDSPFRLTGIIHLQTDPFTGKQYVGKSKSSEAFARRQSSHNSKLKKQLGKKGDESIKSEGSLENKIHAQSY